MRTCLWNYANIISSTCVADDEVCMLLKTKLELYHNKKNRFPDDDSFSLARELDHL